MKRSISTNSPIVLPKTYPTRAYVEAAAAAVRLYNWQRTGTEHPTWQAALAILDNQDPVVSEEDMALADEILTLMPALREDEYQQRMAVLLQQPALFAEDLPMVASSVVSWQRAKHYNQLARTQQYIGTEKEVLKINFAERIGSRSFTRENTRTMSRRVANNWGSGTHIEWYTETDQEAAWVHQFLTQEGALLVAYTDFALPDRFYKFKGQIKKHRQSKFSRLKETVIEIFWFERLPMCNACGKLTNSSTEDHCQCVEVAEIQLEFGIYDIEVEEL